jgi:hypothetical protein
LLGEADLFCRRADEPLDLGREWLEAFLPQPAAAVPGQP